MIYFIRTVFGILLLLLNSWVFSLLWLWFITPLGIAEITITHSMGLLTIVILMRCMVGKLSESDISEDDLEEYFVRGALSLIVVFIGFCIKSFM